MVNRNTHKCLLNNAWYILCLLSLAQAISITDRYIIAVVAESIKSELQLSNSQLGFLMGPAFLIFYCIFSIPLGMLADSISRRNVIIVGLFVWSVATASAAFADSYSMLLMSRCLLGVGEACLLPAAMSIIAAVFTKTRIARATSIFSLGGAIGKIIAFMGGGALLAALIDTNVDMMGFLGFSAWRMLFIYASVPGFILMLIMFTLKEPQRQNKNNSKTLLIDKAFKHFAANKITYGSLVVSIASIISMSMIIASWTISYFYRVHELSIAQSGSIVGFISIFAATGTLASGFLVDKLSSKGITDSPLLVMIIIQALVVLLGFYLLIPNVNLLASIIIYGILQFILAAATSCYLTALQLITPDYCRATVFSMIMSVVTLVGGSTGPLIIGYMSDKLFIQDDGIGMSMAMALIVFGLLGSIATFYGRNYYIKTKNNVA